MSNNTSQATTAPKALYEDFLKLIQGFQTAFPTGGSLVVNGKTATQAQLVQLCQAAIAPMAAAADAKAAFLIAKAANEAAVPGSKELFQQLKGALIGTLGRKNPELAKFGLAPHAPKALTPEQKQIRSAKAKVTRQKRHTLGPRQKAGIKADGVPTVTIGPEGMKVIPSAIDQPAAANAAPAAPNGGSTGTGN